jgi:predicted porin
MAAAVPAIAQQKTGPGVTGDEALTWNGITFYGVIDVGVQYDSHSAPFSDYRPGASAELVQKFSRESVTGVTSSNMGQSRVGLQATEPLMGGWSAVFQLETFFNPQSGDLADSLKAVVRNNGLTPATESTFTDGSSAGQTFQTAYAGLSSKTFGTLTYGRQLTLLSQDTIKYDPQQDAIAFGLLGATGVFSGGGSSEDRRMDSMLKYTLDLADRVRVSVLRTLNSAGTGSGRAFQADLGVSIGGLSVDGAYSKISDAIAATPLTAKQVGDLPALGYAESDTFAATVSDNTAYALMASYTVGAVKLYGGYERIQYANPSVHVDAGELDIGGYTLGFVNDDNYANDRVLNLYWTGIRYSVTPKLDLAAAYYTYEQNAYGTGKQAGCGTTASNTCSGHFQAVSLTADYHFNHHFDAYVGAMQSNVEDGLASGYAYFNTNINPTIGVRFKF